jgi:hypothetical protein
MASGSMLLLSRVMPGFLPEMTTISHQDGGHWAWKSCMIRPFPCVGLAPTQTGQGRKERTGKYAESLYPSSDISIGNKTF